MTIYEILSTIISIFSLIITSILTIYIFIKNIKLTKKQTELQEQIFKYQEKQDKIMNLISEKPYLESIFKLLYKSYDFVSNVTYICTLKEENYVIAHLLFDTLKENNFIYDNFDFKFDKAITYTDGDFSLTISEIKECLIMLEKDIGRLVLIVNNKLQQNGDFNFKSVMDSIEETCEQIGSTQKYVTKSLRELLKNNNL